MPDPPVGDPPRVHLDVRPRRGGPFRHAMDGDRVSIGRSRENDLQLADESLSRLHAVVHRRDGRLWLEDLGSRNGSFLNGERVEGRLPLRPGDRVLVGGTEISVVAPPGVQLTESRAPLSDATATFDVTKLATGTHRTERVFSDMADENRALGLVSRAGAVLITHRPLTETLAEVLDLALEAFGADRAAVAVLEPESTAPDVALARGPQGTIDLELSRTVARTVMAERTAVAVTDVRADPRLASSDSVRLQGIRSLMCAPLWDGAAVRGLVYVDRRLGRGDYSETDLKVLSMLANVLAVKIENARLLEDQMARQRLEEELAVAGRIQQRLLPREAPGLAGLRVAGICRACSEVGGDFFDYLPRAEGGWAIIVADVCGKGVAGALLAASVQAALRGSLSAQLRPAEQLAWLNEFLLRHGATERFVTAAWLEVDAASGLIRHSVAGHPPPLLLRSDGSVESLDAGGLPLGMFAEATWDVGETELRAGDRVVLYTDGVYEAAPPDARDRYFGLGRLTAAVRAAAPGDAHDACERVFSELGTWTEQAPLRDDATVVVLAS